jgi:metal-responsive CopG/Arc/MetJ family transcriptional regulator
MKKSEGARVTIQMPQDLKAFLEERARDNWTSKNSEAIRAIRAAKDAEQRAAG